MSQVMAEPPGRQEPEQRQQPQKVPLGEELPIFCERCGYSLHGAPQLKCDHCTLLHFVCAECGHRQHINTLRPAVARWLGRLRAGALGFWVFFKLNYFGWLLFAWAVLGYEWVYQYSYARTVAGNGAVTQSGTLAMRRWDLESVMIFVCFGLAFGLVSRMLLLKWRRAWAVAAALAALTAAAAVVGTLYRHWEWKDRAERWGPSQGMVMPGWMWSGPLEMAGLAMMAVMLGALIAWPLWVGLVRLFLPGRTADALLDWQRGEPADPLGVR